MTESILTDQDFIEQFELCTLNPENFNHTGHIRLAWLYLQQNEENIAVEKVIKGIQAYAHSLGAKNKFHKTITHSLVKLIAIREHCNASASWQVFNQKNQDLVQDSIAVLLQYYDKSTLFSELARTELVQPDLKNIS